MPGSAQSAVRLRQMTFDFLVDRGKSRSGAAAFGRETFLPVTFFVELHVATDLDADGVEDAIDEPVVGVEVSAARDDRCGGEEIFDPSAVAWSRERPGGGAPTTDDVRSPAASRSVGGFLCGEGERRLLVR